MFQLWLSHMDEILNKAYERAQYKHVSRLLETPVPWVWHCMPNIYFRLNHILAYTDKDWNYHYLSFEDHSTYEDIVNNPAINWNYEGVLSYRSDTTIDLIVSHALKPWNFSALSEYADVCIKDVVSHPEIPWDLYRLSHNRNVILSDVLSYYPIIPWDFRGISRKANIMISDVLSHQHLPWDWACLSANKNICIFDVLQNLNKPWDWFNVCKNRYNKITVEIVVAYPDVPWNWHALSLNKNIVYADVLKFPNLPWHWMEIVRKRDYYKIGVFYTMTGIFELGDLLMRTDLDIHWEYWDTHTYSFYSKARITMKHVLDYPNFPWDWTGLSRNKHIAISDILAHPDKPWDWINVSLNPRLTFDEVLSNQDKPWDWTSLSSNRGLFKINKTKFMCDIIDAVTRIQASFRGWYWRKTILWNPHCEIGRRFLELEATKFT